MKWRHTFILCIIGRGDIRTFLGKLDFAFRRCQLFVVGVTVQLMGEARFRHIVMIPWNISLFFHPCLRIQIHEKFPEDIIADRAVLIFSRGCSS